MQGFIPFVSPC